MSEPRSAPAVLASILGGRVAALRAAAGFTAVQAASRLRLAPTTVTRVEKAETAFKFATVKTLLEVYGVSQAEIVSPSRQGFTLAHSDRLPFSGSKSHSSLMSSARTA